MQYDKEIAGSSDPYPIGHLTLEWTQSSASSCPSPLSPLSSLPTSYNSIAVMAHDAMGRVQVEQQCPNPQGCGTTKYAFNYAYDLAGNPTSFNNGMPVATSSVTAPALNWGITYQSSGAISAAQIGSVSVSPFLTATPFSNPTTPGEPGWSAASFPTTLLNLPVSTTQPNSSNTGLAFGPMGHMVNEQASVSSSNVAGPKIASSFDDRGRIIQEQALGQDTATIATDSFGVIGISGYEQSTDPPATVQVTFGGQEEQPVLWYPCGNPSYCQQTSATDQGEITVTINGQAANTGWGGSSTATSVAEGLVGAINTNTNTLGANATLSGSTVWITANNLNSPLTISVTVADAYAGLSNDPFPTPSFTASASQSQGGTTVYDTGTVSVKLTSGAVGSAESTEHGGSILRVLPICLVASAFNSEEAL